MAIDWTLVLGLIGLAIVTVALLYRTYGPEPREDRRQPAPRIQRRSAAEEEERVGEIGQMSGSGTAIPPFTAEEVPKKLREEIIPELMLVRDLAEAQNGVGSRSYQVTATGGGWRRQHLPLVKDFFGDDFHVSWDEHAGISGGIQIRPR